VVYRASQDAGCYTTFLAVNRGRVLSSVYQLIIYDYIHITYNVMKA